MGWDLCPSWKSKEDVVKECVRDSEESKTLKAYYVGDEKSGELWCEKSVLHKGQRVLVIFCYIVISRSSNEPEVEYLFKNLDDCNWAVKDLAESQEILRDDFDRVCKDELTIKIV